MNPNRQSWEQPRMQQQDQWQRPPPPPQNQWQRPPPPPQNPQWQQGPPQQPGYNNQGYEGQYYQPPPPGCCAPDPNPTPCCAPSPMPQQPGPGGVCGCWSDPVNPCCPTDDPMGPCYCMTSCCDFTTWLVCTFTFLTFLGFILVLATSSTDNIFKHFEANNAVELTAAVLPEISIEWSNTTECMMPSKLFGSFGMMCDEQTLSGPAMLINLSQWNNFRGTLYFLAMMGTLAILFCIIIVHRTKNPNPYGNPQMLMQMQMQQQQGGQQQQWGQPIEFYGTPLYHVFRAAWFASGCITFFWFVNEMYSYWWYIDFYKNNTTGKLHDFWAKYDRKYVATVLIVVFYLCWPLVHLCLEFILYFLLVLPWALYRSMCNPNLEHIRPPEDVKFEDIPCCIRMDMFFCECNQGRRGGFGQTLWELVTGGIRTPYFDCCEMGQAEMMPNSMAMQDGRTPQPTRPRDHRRGDEDDEVVTSGQFTGQDNYNPTRGFQPNPGNVSGSREMRSSGGGLPPKSDTPRSMVKRSKSWVSSGDEESDKENRKKSSSKDKHGKSKHRHHHSRGDSMRLSEGDMDDVRASRDSKEKRSKDKKEKHREKKEKHSRSRSNLEEEGP